MIVQSLKCMNPIQSSITNGEVGGGVGGVSKSPKCKIVLKYGRKVAKTEEQKELPEESSLHRRVSTRIAKLKAEKELLVRRRVELPGDKGDGDEKKTSKRSRRNDKNVGKEEVVKEEDRVDADMKSDERMKSEQKSTIAGLEEKVDSGSGAANVVGKSDSAKVKETLRLFNKHYLHFVQEEEKRCRKVEADQKASIKRSKSKVEANRKASKKGSKLEANPKASKIGSNSKKYVPPEDMKGTHKRPDLKAVSKMMDNNEILYPEKRVGNIPGIEVGHQFYSRCEMVAVGFHSHWLNGIDYMGISYRKVQQYSNYILPVAVAIVLSGMYEDDIDNAEDVVYTGQGGHNLTGDKRQIRDQVLERGNLALKNCVEQCVPVRVVRGHESASSYSGKVYTYDGLYKVANYWAEKGLSGFTVFKFRLRRLEGQPTLTTNQVYFTNGRVPQSVAEIRGLVCEDITGSQEDVPIPATNLVDDPPVAPTGFTYHKSIQVDKSFKLPTDAPGCQCKGICIDSTFCECASRNGSDFPYVSRDGGRLIEAKDVVFECGPNCGCGPGCVNRTSQRGLRYRLEVFRTPKKGWAVRSWDFIPAGAPVCEYKGLLMRTEDAEDISESNYIFELDFLQTIKGIGGRERRTQGVLLPSIINLLDKYDDCSSEGAPEFCIDAGSTGNVARFINHSCEPNLFVQCVLSSHDDLRTARVVLFASDNIPPLQELSYDYGYALDSVLGPDGKIKRMACYCGAAGCRKRLY